MDWTNNTGRNVRVRGLVVEPGDTVEIDDPSPSEKLMFGNDEEEDQGARKTSSSTRPRRGKRGKTDTTSTDGDAGGAGSSDGTE